MLSEQRLLLENIASLPDKDDTPIMSADGNFLVLDEDSPGSAPTSPPTARVPSQSPPLDKSPSLDQQVPESEA